MQRLASESEQIGATAPAPKMDEVVSAHNFFTPQGMKPIYLTSGF
jgi:hypothetical protein